MRIFLESTGCEESTTNGLGKDGKIIKVSLQSGKNIHYNGPNLLGSGVKTCDIINNALQKIDVTILDLKHNCLKFKNY